MFCCRFLYRLSSRPPDSALADLQKEIEEAEKQGKEDNSTPKAPEAKDTPKHHKASEHDKHKETPKSSTKPKVSKKELERLQALGLSQQYRCVFWCSLVLVCLIGGIFFRLSSNPPEVTMAELQRQIEEEEKKTKETAKS